MPWGSANSAQAESATTEVQVPAAVIEPLQPVTAGQKTGVEDTEIEAVDFSVEEKESDRMAQRILAAAGDNKHQSRTGSSFKLFLDLLLDYQVGQKHFMFRPNHLYVLVQAQIDEHLSAVIHISDNPVFFELDWNVRPHLVLRAGKLLIPFGLNEFHHLFGGRVDETSSFLPETWGDYGLGLTHQAYNGENLNLEYSLYVVNGVEGETEPLIGSGDSYDNNLAKGLGGRIKLGLGRYVTASGSAYYDLWDKADRFAVFFYAAGLELAPGLINIPGLRKLRLRGEWARGEMQMPGNNFQKGLIAHTQTRGAFYSELSSPIVNDINFRVRIGRINPDNRVTDEGDLDLLEPAFLWNFGKISLTLAYQMVKATTKSYSPTEPADVLYAKFFLQY